MRYFVVILGVALSGCAVLERDEPAPVPAIEPTDGETGLRPKARPQVGEPAQAALEDAEALAEVPAKGSAVPDATLPPPAGAGGVLGTTVASLGDPGEGGMWLNTPLVREQRAGQVSYQGNVVAVTLRPSGGPSGAGSEISLRAMQALGAPLTELVDVTVEAF